MSIERWKVKKESRIIEPSNRFDVAVAEFPRTLVGKIMHSIHFFGGISCPNKPTYMEALKVFAEEIIEDVKTNNF